MRNTEKVDQPFYVNVDDEFILLDGPLEDMIGTSLNHFVYHLGRVLPDKDPITWKAPIPIIFKISELGYRPPNKSTEELRKHGYGKMPFGSTKTLDSSTL